MKSRVVGAFMWLGPTQKSIRNYACEVGVVVCGVWCVVCDVSVVVVCMKIKCGNAHIKQA